MEKGTKMIHPLRQLHHMLKVWNRNRKYFTCPYCGWTILKTKATISGGYGHAYGSHVHCGKCGKIIAYDL
jgi:ribosomal protein S27E